MRWLIAFALTQSIEAPIYWVASKRLASAPMSRAERALVAIGPSSLTHPIVWFVVPWLLPAAGIAVRLIVAEAFAVIAEALFLRVLGVRRPFWLSLGANAVSASVGLALSRAGVF